ncbi:hypothetical protein Pd630_LPD03596 [Rhodococcus opacus PD630]|nr:hypothetical protein Pd630_LPD03596 [Rhodococcus opacus PD630]
MPHRGTIGAATSSATTRTGRGVVRSAALSIVFDVSLGVE